MLGSGVYLYIVFLCRTESCPGNQDARLPVLSANIVQCWDNDSPHGPHPPCAQSVGLGQGLTWEARVCGQVSEPS